MRCRGANMEMHESDLERLARKEQERRKKPAGKGGYMKGKSSLASNVGNVFLALDQEPKLTNAFAYDEMLRTDVLLRPLFEDDPHFKPRPVTDADCCAVQAHLQ